MDTSSINQLLMTLAAPAIVAIVSAAKTMGLKSERLAIFAIVLGGVFGLVLGATMEGSTAFSTVAFTLMGFTTGFASIGQYEFAKKSSEKKGLEGIE